MVSSFLVGDEVEFKVKLHRSSNIKRAVQVRLVKPGGPRYRGVLIKHSPDQEYDVIDCLSNEPGPRTSRVYFSPKQLLPAFKNHKVWLHSVLAK